MSTGMFSTSSNVVHNNQLGEGGNVGAAGRLQIHNSPAYTPSMYDPNSNNKTLNARLLARVITGFHYT
jgi:hypothetical protein